MHTHEWSDWERDGDYHDARHCTGCKLGQSRCAQTGHMVEFTRKAPHDRPEGDNPRPGR